MALAPTALVALLLTAGPGSRTGPTAVALAPLPALEQLVPQAMVPPPDVVVRTLATYGSVTIDHEKHLAARAACARCHGPGRAGKIELGARVGHARCISCHTEVARGPTQCAGCHARGATRRGAAVAAVEPKAAEEPAAAAEPETAAEEPAPAEPPAPAAEPAAAEPPAIEAAPLAAEPAAPVAPAVASREPEATEPTPPPAEPVPETPPASPPASPLAETAVEAAAPPPAPPVEPPAATARAPEPPAAPRAWRTQPPAPPTVDLPAQPLAKPPDVVVRTLDTFGSVTFDHRKHLAARASCVRCHGPGRVGKVELGARVAHARCVTCHTELSRGPTQCAGCHDRGATRRGSAVAAAPPPPPEPTDAAPHAVEEAQGASTGPGTAEGSPAPASPAPTGTSSTPEAPPRTSPAVRVAYADLHAPPPVEPPAPHRTDRQLLQLGFDAGSGVGGSLRIASRGERFESAYSIARLSDGARARVLMLFDYGIARALGAGFSWWAVGTVGFDAQELPALGFSPAIGARAGVEWALPRGWIVRSLHLSATGLLAVPPAVGDQRGGGRFFLTVATGLPIPGLKSDAAP